jgi:hypothetical protein
MRTRGLFGSHRQTSLQKPSLHLFVHTRATGTTPLSVNPIPAGVMALAGTNDEAVRKAADATVNMRIFIVSLLG